MKGKPFGAMIILCLASVNVTLRAAKQRTVQFTSQQQIKRYHTMRQQNDCFTRIVLTILVHSKVTWQRKSLSTRSSGDIIKSDYGSTYIQVWGEVLWFTVTAWSPRRQLADGLGRRSRSLLFASRRSLRTTLRWQESPCSGRTPPRRRSGGLGYSTEPTLGAWPCQPQWSSLPFLFNTNISWNPQNWDGILI